MPQAVVSFGLLGPLRIEVAGAAIDIRSAQSRVLLGALLCRPNSVVGTDELIDLMWDSTPPAGASTTLRSHVMRLRRALGAAGSRIETAGTGYRIRVDTATELDWTLFIARCEAARNAELSGDWADAARAAAEALLLWRGNPLPDVSSARLQRDERPVWTEAHASVSELLARANLAQGQGGPAIATLLGIVAQHPHREQAHALLMSALAAEGRRVEALEVYRGLRTMLVRDLGIEPGPEVRALQRRILAADAAGAPDAAEPPAWTASWQKPQTLPRDVADFTGREDAVKRIVDVLTAGDRPGTSQVVVIDGMGGVGKSALAVHAAHRTSDRFRDGQLFADLRGTSATPAEPGTVLGSFLYLLGVPAAELPAADSDRSALYRSILADRRVLILLDDAQDTAQILPLIPASSRCAVIITVRHRLLGLAGSERLTLEGLTRGESRTLLDLIAGADRVRSEPEATDTVLSACADLPLAVRVAAGRLASRPQWRMRDLADRFTAARHRLAELTFGQQSVQASLEVGFAGLTESSGALGEAARALCLLGLWQGSDLGLAAAASLIGRPQDGAEHLLEHLVDLHMLRSPRPGRYALHDLLRDFAAQQARSRIEEAELRAAAARLACWYTHAVAAMDSVLRPTMHIDYSLAMDCVSAAGRPESVARAVEWGEREHTNLLEAVRLCREYELDDTTWRLAAMLWGFFSQQRHHRDLIAVNEAALDAARRLGDARAEVRTRNNLATALCVVGRAEEALEHLQACVDYHEARGDFQRAANTLSNLGIASAQVGRHDEAVAQFRRSIELAESPKQRAYGHTNLGYLFLLLERYEESIAESGAAERFHRAQPEPEIEFADVLENLAQAHRRRGSLTEALEYGRELVAVRRRAQDRQGLSNALGMLADLLTQSGDAEGAGAARAEAEALADS